MYFKRVSSDIMAFIFFLNELFFNFKVATHNYNKAIEYYENSLRQFPDRADLKLDLGNLYLMINNFKKAQDFLTLELFSDDFQAPNTDTLKRNVQGFLSIYKLHLKKQVIIDKKKKKSLSI